MSLEEWVTGFTYALFSVLILIEVGTLIKLLREGEHKECIKIMVLYIISNAAMIVCTRLNIKLTNENVRVHLLVVWIQITFATYFICSNVAHWLFCFEYYHMVRIIKYVHDDIPVPPEIEKCDRIQYWVWIILCICSSLVYLYFVGVMNMQFFTYGIVSTSTTIQVSISSFIAVGIIITTGIYLAYAIYKIRKIILEYNEKSIDTKILIVHITSFSLNLVAQIAQCVSY